MIKGTLKDQLPLEIQEKLAKLREASKSLAGKPLKIHKGGKKRAGLPGNPAKELGIQLSPVDKENKKKAREQFIAAQTWLKNTFPNAFNFKEPKPLKLNIEHDIFQVQSPFSRTLIRKVVAYYTSNTAYVESVAQGRGRINLQGEKVGKVKQAEQDHALQQLQRRRITQEQKRRWQHNKKKENKRQDKDGIDTSAIVKA